MTDSSPPRPAIAVVAVHGIGDHRPGDSAASVAELLLRLRYGEGDGENRYTSFRTTAIGIPTKRAFVSSTPAGAGQGRWARWIGGFRERSAYLQGLERQGRLESAAAPPSPETVSHEFMRAQLDRYVGSSAPYETVRIEGKRLPQSQPTNPQADVHVYEVQWSELSRLKWSAAQIGYQIYQLVFHIPHLGRQAVDHAAVEHPRSLLWRIYHWVHTAAVRVFTLFVPLMWITMAATVLTVVPPAIPSAAVRRWVSAVLPAVFALYVVGRAIYRARTTQRRPLAAFLAAAIAATAVGLGVFWLMPLTGARRLLCAEWIVVATAGTWWMAGRYERVRPGARVVGATLQILAALPLLVLVLVTQSATGFVDRTLNVFEIEFIVVLAGWAVFYALATASGILGAITALRARDAGEKRDLHRAAWTARATLGIAGTVVLAVGMPLWALLYRAFAWALPAGGVYTSLTGMFGPRQQYYAQYVESLFAQGAGAGYLWLMVFAAVVMLVAAWTVLPSVWAEVSPPEAGSSFADHRQGAATPAERAAYVAKSKRLGAWLSAGGRLSRLSATCLFSAMVVAAGATLVHWVHPLSFLTLTQERAKILVLAAGAWLAASAVGVAAFRGRFANLMLGFRPVLDALLDVDDYLREHPRTNTPRARIAERFASLLRYLCKWRDATGRQGYRAIVFVAHSQGTVITADFLRFIRRERDPELADLLAASEPGVGATDGGAAGAHQAPRLYLFTMGSPLRQLYAAAFPQLFRWVTGAPGGAGGEPAPDPAPLGVHRWANAYRGGDYVGRQLWRDPASPDRFVPCLAPELPRCGAPDPASHPLWQDAIDERREFCIGAGAHTHYWDATAWPIASELDRLIVEALK